MKPIAPRPAANNGKAAGMGTVFTVTIHKLHIESRLLLLVGFGKGGNSDNRASIFPYSPFPLNTKDRVAGRL